MKTFFTMLFLITSCLNVFAQPLVNLNGHLINKNKKPIAGASILLINKSDTLTGKTIVAKENGQFKFTTLQAGNYKLIITAVGFTKYIDSNIIIDLKDIELGIIELKEANANELKSVTITADKPLIEQKIDRTVVNVDAAITNTGTTALDVLEKSPGVTVDENGSITYKGKTGVLVLIDDKPTYLSAADLATYLKSLPSSMLDKIELMDNSPAKYDAAGTSVINIKTKKSKAKGFNGSIAASYGQGIYGRNNASVNINYHEGKINLFTNLAYNEQQIYRRLDVGRNYLDANNHLLYSFLQTAYFAPVSHNGNLKLGMDYAVSPKTTVGFVFTGTLAKNSDHRPGISNLYSNVGKLDSSIVADNYSNSTFNKAGINLNYSHQFDTLGKLLTVDLDYVHYGSNSDQSFLNNIYLPNSTLQSTDKIINDLPSDIKIYAVKSDYSQPLKGKAKLEAGVKSSYVTTDNTADYFNVVNGINTIDYTNTNRFLYNENINAAYLNYTNQLNRFEFQAGLRLENTNSKGNQLGNALIADSSFTKHYTNLFPTAYLSYKLDSAGNNIINFSFGRRIGRPYYQDLNPFVFIINKFTYFSGNPYLRPQFTDNFQVSYHYKSIFTSSIIYSRSTDIQIETDGLLANGIFISRTGNIGQSDFINFNINTTLKPAKWWTMNIYAEVYNNHFKGAIYNGFIDQNSIGWYSNINNQFKLGNNWAGELSGFYNAKHADAQFKKIPSSMVNAALQKKIWQNKATIKFSARDIFRGFTSSGFITNIPNAIVTYNNYFDQQALTLGFTYSFGKQFENKAKRNIGSADSEAGRVRN